VQEFREVLSIVIAVKGEAVFRGGRRQDRVRMGGRSDNQSAVRSPCPTSNARTVKGY
jgi:hypothetical protein